MGSTHYLNVWFNWAVVKKKKSNTVDDDDDDDNDDDDDDYDSQSFSMFIGLN